MRSCWAAQFADPVFDVATSTVGMYAVASDAAARSLSAPSPLAQLPHQAPHQMMFGWPWFEWPWFEWPWFERPWFAWQLFGLLRCQLTVGPSLALSWEVGASHHVVAGVAAMPWNRPLLPAAPDLSPRPGQAGCARNRCLQVLRHALECLVVTRDAAHSGATILHQVCAVAAAMWTKPQPFAMAWASSDNAG